MYPDGASCMFFKMFLDKEVKDQLAEYDVFAIVEHDVLVAHPSSFSKLYSSAFDGGEEYWVKGSVLGETQGYFGNTLARRGQPTAIGDY